MVKLLLHPRPWLLAMGFIYFLFVFPFPLSKVASQSTSDLTPAKPLIPRNSNWYLTYAQGFEGDFPPPGFVAVDLSTDSFDRKWAADDYRRLEGLQAVWPARGGDHGRDPVAGNDNYFNNMDTRLIFGPFDLSQALAAELQFAMIQEVYYPDQLRFEASTNGVNFAQLQYWGVTYEGWITETISLDNYIGDNSVWVAWRFVSNDNTTRDGPWVDKIELWEYRLPTPTPSQTPPPTLTPTPRPQTEKVYLSLVNLRYPLRKERSGLHLGNRPSANVGENDWNVPSDYLFRLKGTTLGALPATIVVLSDQIYNIQRSGADCEIIDVVGVKNPYAFSYLQRAAQSGTKIIIRVYPSPGNFTDALQPEQDSPSTHNLVTDVGVKAQPNSYCDVVDRKKRDGTIVRTAVAYEFYRDVRDIAREMKAIHDYNVAFGGNIAAHEFFMPANEPNLEWYSRWYNTEADPREDKAIAWSAMNAYFVNLYDTVKTLDASIRVLTPAMGQNLKGERIEFASCVPNTLFVPTAPDPIVAAGYDYMEEVYRYKNDGIVWHNYWFQAKEFWDNNFCTGPAAPTSHHIAQYFPIYLAEEIAASGRPTFILEADLLSPCQLQGNPIQNKDAFNNGEATAESLWRFIEQEHAAQYVVGWLLTERPHYVEVGQCVPSGEASEISWHEAYRETGTERGWFSKWWSRSEVP